MKKTIIISEEQAKHIVKRRALKEVKGYDMSDIGGVNCTLDFDEDAYAEWLEDNQLQDIPEVKTVFIKDYCSYDVEYLEAETFHVFDYDIMSYDEVLETFGDRMGMAIINDCMDGREHSFETLEYVEDTPVDLSNPDEVAAAAVKYMRKVDYPTGQFRGFILTNGVVVDAGWDHISCMRVPGVKSREHFVQLGNIRFSNVSLEFAKYPTGPQQRMLQMFCEYHQRDTIYVDLINEEIGRGGFTYQGLEYEDLMSDIYNYFRHGIRRHESSLYESIDELDLYHGTHADFDQFKEEFYLSGVGEMAYGWGVYLTNSINTAKEYSPGGQIMTVEVPDGKYLNSERIGKVEASNLARAFYRFYLNGKGAEIYKGSEKEFWDYECKYLETVPDGSYMYGTVSTFLGSDKEASEWFHSMGYAGLKFPGHNTNTGEKFMNYVIFDANDVKIINKQQTDSLNESVNMERGITKLDICNRTMRVIERRNGIELSDEGKKWFIGLMNGAKFGITMDMILEKAAFNILNIPSFPVGQSVGNEWDELDGILRVVIQKTGLGNDILQRLRALKWGEDRKIISDGEWIALETALLYYPDVLKELKRCYGNFAVVAPVIYKAVDYLKRYKDGTAALEFCYLVGYQREHARASLGVAVDQVLHGVGSHLLPQVTSKK